MHSDTMVRLRGILQGKAKEQRLRNILLGAEVKTKKRIQIQRLERLIESKGGVLPSQGRGTLAYKETLQFFNSELIAKLRRKGFNVDLHSLSDWVRYKGKIYYRKGCAYYGELKELCEESGGFGLLSQHSKNHVDQLAIWAPEEAGFYIQDVDDFLCKLKDDLRERSIFSMWKEIEIDDDRDESEPF